MDYHIDLLAEAKSVRPGTIDGYRRIANRVVPLLGGKLICELTFVDIEDFCFELNGMVALMANP